MNAPVTSPAHKALAGLIAYAFIVVAIIVTLLGIYFAPDSAGLAGLKDQPIDAYAFGAIGLCGVIAIQMGASLPMVLSVGTWGAFVALTAHQPDPLVRYLTFAAVLFSIGMYGMVASRNAVRVLMSIELMLNAVNLNLVAFARYVDPANIKGQVFAIFILTVAAAEAAVGLAIVLAVYRNMSTVDMDRFNLLKW